MRTIKLDENSIWLKIASFGEPRPAVIMDICDLLKCVLRGLGLGLTITFIASLVVAFVGGTLWHIAQSIWYWKLVSNEATQLGMILVAIILFVVIANYVNEFRKSHLPEKTSVLREMYSSWKDKTCVRVDVIRKDDDDNV